MAFGDAEQSPRDSRVKEIYDFVGADGTYRYTSAKTSFAFDGNTYSAIPIMRKAIKGRADSSPGELVVEMPAITQLVKTHGFGVTPETLTLQVRRVQSVLGLARTLWQGSIQSISFRGFDAILRCTTLLDDAMRAEIPNAFFQKLCNHVLYDARCTLNELDFDISTTIVNLTNNGDGVLVASVGGNPNNYYRGGRIVHDSTGEQRLIVLQIGQTLTISSPFRSAAISDAVTVFAGCDRSIKTCRDKFSNVANFGGHPWMELAGSPFEPGGIRGMGKIDRAV